MAKTRKQKEEILAGYEKYLKDAKAVYLASTRLTANEATDLKKKLLPFDSTYGIVKNTVFGLAAKNALGEDLKLEGPVAAVVSNGDVVEAAKLLAALKKEDKATYVLAILDGKVLDGSQIEALSKLESKEALLGKLMYLVNYPTTGFARALANNIEKLAYALNAVKEQKA
jgi:large subunit ribosomal protein L10